jgi:hypothetical protein
MKNHYTFSEWKTNFSVSVKKTFLVVLGFWSFMIFLVQPLTAGSGVLNTDGETSMVDWSGGTIRAKGIGVPPSTAASSTHAHAMAKKAARVVAYGNLLETIQGIHVDAETEVKNFMLENALVKTKVKGIVNGARVIEEKAFPDGSYEVTVEMGMAEKFLDHFVPPADQPPTPISNSKFTQIITLSTPEGVNYTGLVVDAKGLNVQKCLNPKIFMEDGQTEVYGSDWIDPELHGTLTVISYVKEIPQAKNHDRVKNNPLIVKALRTANQKPTDLIIDDADAQLIHMDPKHLELLKKGKVVVVVD